MNAMTLDSNRRRWRAVGPAMDKAFPWLAPILVLAWGWRVGDPFHALPGYGDVFEVLWGLRWFGDRLLAGSDVSFFEGIFHPFGWRLMTFAHSPAMLVALLPLYKIGGAAFAYNIATLGAFLLGYGGLYVLARRMGFSSVLAAFVAALFAFCSMRWLRIGGHLNQLIGSSLLPWLLWSLERAWSARASGLRWFALAGLLWGIASAISFYFIWLGAIVVGGFLLAKVLADRASWKRALAGLGVASLIAAALSAPVLWPYFRGLQLAHAPTTNIGWITEWGASLNSLPMSSISHPISWVSSLSQWAYRGPRDESMVANLGALASLVALVGLWRVRNDRLWHAILLVTGLGLVLALGYILRWNGQPVELPAFRGLNSAIWAVGHRLKPDLFHGAAPYGPLVQGLPLPGLLLAAVVPFWEGARTLSRFAFIALPGFYLMVGLGLQAIRRPVFQLALALLLVVEFLPRPSVSLTATPAPHPVFAWLQANTPTNAAIIDLAPSEQGRLELMFSGEVLWAGQYHQRTTAAGAGSVWPSHTNYLRDWFILHPHPGRDPGLALTLQEYQVSFILLHMRGANAEQALADLKSAPEIQFVDCFDKATAATAWPYQICVLQVSERPPGGNVRVQPGAGWSGIEPWGRWAEGTESTAAWLAFAPGEYRLQVEAFPQCDPIRGQRLEISNNGRPLAEHRWQDGCAPWTTEIIIPAENVRVGWNDLLFRSDYAARPIDLTGGANPDVRPLSVGFSRLSVSQ